MEIQIPRSFQVEPFYRQSSIIIEETEIDFDQLLLIPFFNDITEWSKPWEQREQILPLIFVLWDQTRAQLAPHYKNRQTEDVQEMMISMCALTLSVLFWINKLKVTGLINLKTHIEALPFKPPNCYERIQFIINRPKSYHSFTQVNSLFEELKKMFAKVRVIESRQ